MPKTGKTDEESLKEVLEGDEPEKESKETNPVETKDSAGKESPETQSKETQTPQVQTFKMSDGRELSADQVFEEYNKLNSEFTRKSQRLSELEKTEEAKQSGEEGKPTLSAQDQAVLKELKEKFGVMTREEFTAELEKVKPTFIREAAKVSISQSELNEALTQLEEDFDGSEIEVNGEKITKPKVEKQKVFEFIVKNPNTDLSPLDIARFLYNEDFIKYEAKQMVGNGSAKLPETEASGASVTDTPAVKPLSFKDGSAEKALEDMIGVQAPKV